MAREKKKTTAGGDWGLVRKGAHRIDLYDEGGGLFFYDEANATAIARDLPRRLGSPDDPAHGRLAQAGRLVTVVLGGDGMASLELAVGPPLDETERQPLPFLDPQEALLVLPSGRLHVETPSTIPIPWPSADPGFVTEVPPGRYRLTLYRLDTLTLDRERDRRGKKGTYGGPRQFVTLTPIGTKGKVATPAVIPWIEARDESWIGRYAVADGVFKGLARVADHWDSFRTNFDVAAARAVALEPGAGIEVTVPDLSFAATAVYSPDPSVFGFLVELPSGEKRGMPAEFAVAHWEDDLSSGQGHLRFWRIKTKRCFEERDWGVWQPAELRFGPAPKLAKAFLERIALAGAHAKQAHERHRRRLGSDRPIR
ncbi:MAG: hypothetical protein ACREMV_12495 [Gemmatimonadales bacterium]